MLASLKFCLFTSFQWLFSLNLRMASDLPVYCLLHYTNLIRYIRYLLLQLHLLYILKVLRVTIILNVFVESVCDFLYSRSYLAWSCTVWNNHFDQYSNCLVSALDFFVKSSYATHILFNIRTCQEEILYLRFSGFFDVWWRRDCRSM